MNVFVGYATEHGSTREVAERVGARIRQLGMRAEVRSLAEAGTLDEYDAFVLGSAVHGQAWLTAAVQFVDAHAKVLIGHPVWLFSVGMPAAFRGPFRAMADKEGPRILDDLGHRLHPRDHRLFSGVIGRDHLPLGGRVMFRVMGGRYGDFRDPAAVDEWADGIVGCLSEPG
jgi:menaquinone-dependent protoporphyrinogen oxidase